MTRPIDKGDTLPWYRQFWPWFLILLPASVVVAGLTTLYIANRHADDLVVDDYYKDGLAINRQLEKKQRAAEQGFSAQLALTDTSVTIQLSGPPTSDKLQLLLSHPLESDRDFTVSVERRKPGVYQGQLQTTVAPRWHWTLELPQANGWRLDGVIEAVDFNDVDSN